MATVPENDVIAWMRGFTLRRVPFVRQSTNAECGLACLAMISAFHGNAVALHALREQNPVSRRGMTLRHLVAVGAQLGLSGRAVRLAPAAIGRLSLPAILHWDMNHFVVVARVGHAGLDILDPGRGRRRVAWDEIEGAFTGIAIEFSPTAQFSRAPRDRPFRLHDMWERATGLGAALGQAFVLTLLLQAAAFLSPLFLQIVVDQAAPWRDLDFLAIVAGGFAALAIFTAAGELLRSFSLLHLGFRLNAQMGLNLITHLLRLPVTFFHERDVGQIVSRVQSIAHIRRALTDDMISASADALFILFALAMLVTYSPIFAAIAACLVGLYGLVRLLAFGPLRDVAEQAVVAEARESTHFIETVSSIEPVKLFGREDVRRALWQNDNTVFINAQFRLEAIRVLVRSSRLLIASGGAILTTYFGARAVFAQDLTLGALFALLFYSQYFRDRSFEVIDRLSDLSMLGLHADRLADIATAAPEDIDFAASNLEQIRSIELDEVVFAYSDGERRVLNGASLRVTEGEFVAIVGASGSGKSTLVRLLLGLYAPTGGALLINGRPAQTFGLGRLRTRVGAVTQGDDLLSGSLAENISFFDPDIDQALVEHCARCAQIHDEILELPMKYETLIGDVGNVLSGGQKQRVLIARALYRQPDVLLLDEGTANLDIGNERRIADFICDLPAIKIVIAHGPELVSRASAVYELAEGRLRLQRGLAKAPAVAV